VWQELRLREVSKDFPGRDGVPQRVLDKITLTIRRGDFCCVLGPSGCGKTTLLNIVAGFEKVTSGGVFYDDRPVTEPGTDRAVIFQDVSNALFPWLTSVENVQYGSQMQGLPAPQRRERAMHYLELVGLGNDAAKFPFELSGGMKQRVQIARALANEPEVLLMDEPFAALDAINKTILQEELTRVWRETRKTIFYITHDITEAIRLGTQLAVMSLGPGAVILKEFTVDLPSHRVSSHPRFLDLQRQIEDIIGKEVRTRKKIDR
jgi:NitT/TauT family transport system ATP-binding protein